MKTVLNNFIVTLKRFKLASALNIIGLSVAFAAFIVIMTQIRYDRGFDKFHPKTGRIFRVEISTDSISYRPAITLPMVEYIRSAPQVEYSSIFQIDEWGDNNGVYIVIEKNGEKSGFQEKIVEVNSEFIDIFDITITEGPKNAIALPNSVIIPQSLAHKFFGSESAIGRQITVNRYRTATYTVGAVYEDLPENTLMKNIIYVGRDVNHKNDYDGWNVANYNFYISLRSSENIEELEKSWMEAFKVQSSSAGTPTWVKTLRLNPIERIYYSTDIEWDNTPKGNPRVMTILFAIAVLVILIACVNFINFSTALIPVRVRSINIRKVLGSSNAALRITLVTEAIATSLVAFGLALLLVYILGLTSFVNLLTGSLSLEVNQSVVWLSLGMVLLLGLLSGLYPAFYSTSFQPAIVLKGSYGLSIGGRRLRTVLIGFQFVISIALIVAALFMHLQSRYINKIDPGYNTANVAVMKIQSNEILNNRSLLTNILSENPAIEDAGFAVHQIGTSDIYSQRGYGNIGSGGENVIADVLVVGWNIPQILGVELVEGEFFSETDQDSGISKILINQTAQRKYGLTAGEKLEYGQIVGVIKDVNYKSLRYGIEPMAFELRNNQGGWVNVKYTGDPYRMAEFMRESVARIDPAYPVDVQFYDTVSERLYAQERKATGLVTIFSILAVIISLMGVFGLVVFETQYRRKEIGIRKIYGSTVGEILTLVSRNFTFIIIVCFVLAAPVAYIGIKGWLANFAYRTPIRWWVFGLSLLIVVVITFCTVTLQSWRAATANPVDSLKNN